ncbi:putative CBF/NF-Y family transcription factor [Aspergillus ruber CBS 135680]|uniref:DNA polymerase epsilon subunit D n=1 Tax=Aspergillus ruber (strain CBS 135680) TaxID=1388766 RepID=A0A017S4S3_ASPRC|nr:histone-fold-containing protein [Aspergillus ruber CBS 135680]EYE91175.1 histone-fold-containing protein [Aspergillus ruber CBS 135680]
MPSSHPSSSPQATPSQSQPQSQPQHQQVTEQQLKSRAENGVKVEDYLLPRSLTARLAKSVLPPNTTIQKDALLAMQKAATVFVSYLSSHANEATLKRTVAPTDVFSAIEELEFRGFRERLEKELDVYTEVKAGKRKKAGPGGAAAAEQKGEEKMDEEESGVRGAKRVKRVGEGEPGQTKGDDGEGEGDDDEPEPEEEEDIEEEEAEDDEDDEEEEEEGEEAQEDDINLVEDLDRDSHAQRTMDPDAGADSDSDDEEGGSQLRGDMGMD